MSVVLACGGARAAVDPSAGGRLTSLVVGGTERLLQEPAPGVPIAEALRYGSYLMAPWHGRIEDGILDWRGVRAQLAQNNGNHALHGVVFDVPWDVVEASSTSVALSVRIDTSRWPFAGEVRQRYALDENGLDVEAEVIAAEAMPVSLGWHPWFLRLGDDVRVGVTCEGVLETRPDLIPTGRVLPPEGKTDLRDTPPIAGRLLDDMFTGVRSPLRVRWPDLELDLEFGEPIHTAVVFTGVPTAVCVEPVTAWPNGIKLSAQGVRDTDLVTLEPGETLSVKTRWSWRQPGTTH